MNEGHGSAFDRLRRAGRSLTYANPLYEMGLRGPVPMRLRLVPPDPWPGRSDTGHAMLQGRYSLLGHELALGEHPFSAPLPGAASDAWQSSLHGFHWLRHLRASGGEAARRQAARLIREWLEAHERWSEPAWSLVATGARLSHWLSQHEFYAASLDDQGENRLLDSMARQTRHLAKALPQAARGELSGAGLVLALKGWILAALSLGPDEFKLGRAAELMSDALAQQIGGDGGHASRNPEEHLGVLRDLIDIRAAYAADQREMPRRWHDVIERMTPALRVLRHGDGGLATMNGAGAGDPLVIDTALAQIDARGRPVRSLPEMGYERISIGRTILIIDTGAPPARGLDHNAHAGLFGFELSHGRERLIVSCGHDASEGRLFDLLRATAASSTLTVADTNAAEVLTGGGIGRSPRQVASVRESGSYGTRILMSHDGWGQRYGLKYDRAITVSESGDAIFGEERLTGTAGHRYAIRFHLDPDVQVSPIQGGGALLKTPSGSGWRFQLQGAELEVEESLYAGTGKPRKAWQLVLLGETEDRSASALKGDRRTGASIGWSLTRERKPARSREIRESLSF